MRRAPRIRAVTLALAALLCAPHPAQAVITDGANAKDILGQFSNKWSDTTPYYTKGCANNDASQIGLYDPEGIAFDTVHHRLFVADTSNNRVLVFTLTSGNAISGKTPANVLGQPDFANCAGNTTQSGMNGPDGLAYDGTNDRLFVADYNNSRVLVFNTGTITDGMNAANVLGQVVFTTLGSNLTQSGMDYMTGLAFDSTHNRLFVADWGYNRVTVFNTTSISDGMAAANVLGQPDFVSGGAATTQSGMSQPAGLAYDGTNNRLFEVDHGNNRVLVYDVASITDGENATIVFGQPDFVSSGTGASESQMYTPNGVAYDATNSRLFVSELYNNRVLVFSTTSITNGMNASNVLGQPDFDLNGEDTSQSALRYVYTVAFDATNNRLLTGEGNHRVMVFDTASITNGENAVDLLGQYTSESSTATVDYTKAGENNGGVNARGFNNPTGIALDAVNHRLFVADYYNFRVLVYNLNTDNSFPDHTADYVLGQAIFTTNDDVCTQSGMSRPVGLAFDAVHNRLFVADADYNSRVLVYDTSSISNGMNAANELGQTNFTTCGGTNHTQSKTQNPNGVAYDPVNDRLFVADSSNHRVLVYNTSSITDGMNAAFELGHASGGTAFTASNSGATQSRMNIPLDLAFDPVNNRLFVADYNNSRVLVFNTTSITNGQNATNVIGQTNFTNSSGAVSQTRMQGPAGVSYDPTNSRLFVGDRDNNRVLVFNAGPRVLPTNSASAANVLGQADFTTSYNDMTQNMFYIPANVYYDPGSGRLFVSDGQNRVMIFEGDTNATPPQWDFIHGYE